MTEKKSKKFGSMDVLAVVSKQKELTKELLTARLSMDPGSVKSEGGLVGLNRDLKTLNRKLAGFSKNRGKKS